MWVFDSWHFHHPYFASLFGTVHCHFSPRELAHISPLHPNPWHDMLCHHKPHYILSQNSHHTYLSRNFHSLFVIYCHATSTSSSLDIHVILVPDTLGVATSEIMKPRPCFHHCSTVCAHVYYLFACCNFYYRFILLRFATHITRILPSLRRTSAPIQLLVVLGVLGTKETSCFLIAGLLVRDHLQPLLPWVR